MSEPDLEEIVARLSDALECDPFEEQFAALIASWRERGEALREARDELREAAKIERERLMEAVYPAYLGINVLATMTKKAGLSLAYERSRELLIELDQALPGLAGLAALRARLKEERR